MAQAPATTFNIAQTTFSALRFSVDAPLAMPALNITKPPITVVERAGIPDHDAFRELVNLLARPDTYQVPTRWQGKSATVTTNLWNERHEDGCDVTLEVKGILSKGDMLRMALDGQVGVAELLYRSTKPLFAVGQFTAGLPHHVSSIAFCAGVDMLRIIGRNTAGSRGRVWKKLVDHLAQKKVFGGIEEKFMPLISDKEDLVQRNIQAGGGMGLTLHSDQADEGYDPGTRLGYTHPFSAEYCPRQNMSLLFGRILATRTITIKQDLTINKQGKQAHYVLAVQEFMAALEAMHPSLFSVDTK